LLQRIEKKWRLHLKKHEGLLMYDLLLKNITNIKQDKLPVSSFNLKLIKFFKTITLHYSENNVIPLFDNSQTIIVITALIINTHKGSL
jgi:hypothetical protein